MRLGRCDACIYVASNRKETYTGDPDGSIEEAYDKSNWTEYTQYYCHRYPKKRTVNNDHWCGEYKPEPKPNKDRRLLDIKPLSEATDEEQVYAE